MVSVDKIVGQQREPRMAPSSQVGFFFIVTSNELASHRWIFIMNKQIFTNFRKLHKRFQMAIYGIVSATTGKPINLGYSISNQSDILLSRKNIEDTFKELKKKEMERNVDNIIPFPCVDVKKDI